MRRGKGTSPTPEDGSERHWALRSLQRLGNELGSFRGIFTLAGPFAVIVGFLVALLFPELRQLGLSILALGAIALFSLALAWLLRPHNRVARRRQRYGLTATVSILAVVGIVSLVNLLAVNNNVLVDVTASRQYSLAPQTLNVLTERVQGQIEATAFIVEDQYPLEAVTTDRMEEYLREFARQSGGSFSYRVVDPERFPDIASRSGVTQWPIVVFEEVATGKRQSVPATANPEQDFLTALLVVSGLSQKTIYILEGYSPWEPSNLDADARHGFGFASRGLAGDGYAVRTLNLVQDPSVPDDAAAVVVAGPARDSGSDRCGSPQRVPRKGRPDAGAPGARLAAHVARPHRTLGNRRSGRVRDRSGEPCGRNTGNPPRGAGQLHRDRRSPADGSHLLLLASPRYG